MDGVCYTQMNEMSNCYEISRIDGRRMLMWEDNIKIGIKEIYYECVHWMHTLKSKFDSGGN
jgi:hypothetical protein